MKCLSLFSATARLLWQRFLLARVCRSEFDGELISVCAHFLVAYVCTFTCTGATLPDLLLRPPIRTTRITTIITILAWMEFVHLYPKYICFVGASWQLRPLEKPRLTFGISQKRVTLLPNQHMGVTVYPESHHFSQYICSWGGRNSSQPQDTPSCDCSNTLTVCWHIFLLYRNGEK